MGKRIPTKKGAVKRPAAKKRAPKPPKVARVAASGWGAPRAYEPQGFVTARARVAQAPIIAKRRSEAAKRGWQKRHTKTLEQEGLNPRSATVLGELDAAHQQLLHNMRLAVFGPMGYSQDLTGRDPGGLEVLRNMIQYRDKRWETFMNAAQSAGFTSQQARTAFFSPSIRRMAQARAPGLRP
jgi:hypothetical protein